MASRIEMLKQAGFSDAEIGDWATAERRRMHDAGFTDDEIDAEFGVTRPPPDPPAAWLDRLKRGNAAERIAGAAADYARQYFGDAPLGLPPRETEILRRLGIVGDIAIPAAKPVDAALRAVPAGIAAVGAGVGQAVEEAGDAVFGPGPEAKGKAARDYAQLAQIAALLSGAGRSGGAMRIRAPVAGAAGEAAIMLPRAEDFRNAAAAITGLPASFRTEQKLLRLWTEHGIPPDEAARDALRDPALAADLAAETGRLPEAYVRGADATPAAPPARGEPDASPQHAPAGQGGRSAAAESPPAAAAAESRPAAGQHEPEQNKRPERNGSEQPAPGQRASLPAPLIAESRFISQYDPPNVPQRPLTADYPLPPPASEINGRLMLDMDNRPLNALLVAGRRFPHGGDVPVTPKDIRNVLSALNIRLREKSALPTKDPGAMGLYQGRGTPKKPRGTLHVKTTISPQDQDLVLGHEFGHAINHFARDISSRLTRAEVTELRRVYAALRTAPGKTPRQPEDFGYDPHQIKSELMAEGLRAYLTNPNYFKGEAPRTAARIRSMVNNNRHLRKIIQFNSLAAGLIGAGIAAGAGGQDHDGE